MKEKVMYAGEIRFLSQDEKQIPIVVLYCKESEGYLLLKYFDLFSLKLKAACLLKNSDTYLKEDYPLYKLDNYKLADMLYKYQLEDKIHTSTYYKIGELIDLSLGFESYLKVIPDISEGLLGIKENLDKIEFQYEKDLKSMTDRLLDDLLKEDYLSVLHTHFDKGEH